MQYELRREPGYFHVLTRGPADAAVFDAYLAEMVAHPEWVPGTPFIADHTSLDAEPLTMDGLRSIADGCAALREEIGRAKVAVLVPEDLEYGMARQWFAFVSERWDATSKLFRNHADAIAWFREG